jgi:hypothetical protein
MPALSESLVFIPDPSGGDTATTAVVYPNSATNVLVYFSDAHKGDGYFGAGDGLHTVMYVADMNFQGTIKMQASLATNPADSDWFDIDNTSVTYTALNSRNTSTTDMFNFVGNFVWVRGSVSISNGSVLYIQYNH